MSALPQMSRAFEVCEPETGLTPFRIFVEPQQGALYGDLLAVAARAETLGFGAFFRSDHFLKMGSVSGLPGPSDAWVTLANTTSAPRARTTSTASRRDVPRVVVSSTTTTRSEGRRAPASRPVTPWSFASFRTLKLRRCRPRVAATAAHPRPTH